MSDGITWLTDAWRGDAPILFVTFARGISPRDLVVRLGARPGEVLDPITFGEAERLTFNDRESARVARFGECAGWSYAVEQGWPSKAWWAHPDVSAGGVEVLHLTPKPDAPQGVLVLPRRPNGRPLRHRRHPGRGHGVPAPGVRRSRTPR
ncbi:hypothetical protein SAV31267_003120 [Streptomyces avermitilis]|uniref:Uncharacterized protein n=1 Tax=Streptomyces avermitilis TaxID=33903 RepID=A0A4D4MHV0_STRAX|nr:hypothetical protein SAV31267_003120 [Streptomyces avermitilis]